jgi:hypothetical protein
VGAGGLPEAQPVPVGSEAELRSELERVVAQLAPAVEWTQRVDALLRLEGLVKGGAAGFAGFSELLLALRDALTNQVRVLLCCDCGCSQGSGLLSSLRFPPTSQSHQPKPCSLPELFFFFYRQGVLRVARTHPSLQPHCLQMLERRSAVSRQACHAVATLAAACGTTFEPLAVHLLPVVFKTLAMGINVGAGQHCPTSADCLCRCVCGGEGCLLRLHCMLGMQQVLPAGHQQCAALLLLPSAVCRLSQTPPTCAHTPC